MYIYKFINIYIYIYTLVNTCYIGHYFIDCVWNVMAHAQKPDFVFRRTGRVHLNRRGRQFNLLLADEVCASAVVMLDTPYSEVVWRVLAAHSIRQFPLQFPSRASPCAITFQLDTTIGSHRIETVVLYDNKMLLIHSEMHLTFRRLMSTIVVVPHR